MGYFLGVDLGTTYTAAATRRGGHTEIAALSDRSPMVPSVLLLGDDGSILVGEAANRRAIAEPERVAREFKRRFGDPAPLIVGGVPYGADLLTARLLRWVVDLVGQREGGPPEGIALTHPANWGGYKLDLLRQAVHHADLDHATACLTITEPQAAATWYATHERVEPGAVVAVYDLGGGTFDAAVLRRTADGFDLLGSPEGIERLGGIDFDAAVFDHVVGTLGDAWEALDGEDPTVQGAVARLRRECVEAKEALSVDTQASVTVVLPGLHTQVRLTRAELEDMIRPPLAETVGALRRALRSAEVEPERLDKVLLVGGSSRIPLVAQVLGAALGRPIAVDAHPKNAVAQGAATAAAHAAETSHDTGAVPVPPLIGPLPTPAPPGPGRVATGRGPEGGTGAGGGTGDAAGGTVPAGGAAGGGPPSPPGAGAPVAPVEAPAAPPPATSPADAPPAAAPPGGATRVEPPARPTPARPPGLDPRPPVVVPAPSAPAPRTGRAGVGPGAGAHRARAPRSGETPAPKVRRARRPQRRAGAAAAVAVVLLVVAAAVAAAVVLWPDGDPGTERTEAVASQDGGAAAGQDGEAAEAGNETGTTQVDLDRDGNGRLDRPGPPPNHVEPDLPTAPPQVTLLNHGVHDGFERIAIRFSGDLPPAFDLQRDPDRGVVRVLLLDPGVQGASGDASGPRAFEGALGLSARFGTEPGGQAWVDIHATSPVEAQAFRIVTQTPVIAVDLAPGDGPWNPSQA